MQLNEDEKDAELREGNMEMRASAVGLKTLLHPSLHHFIPLCQHRAAETREDGKKRLKHSKRGG